MCHDMVDNMYETIVNSNMGAKYGHITISALLLMDDITLIADTPTELQSMLSIIHMQVMKFHVRFGDDKCKVMMVNNKDPSNYGWRLGSTQLKVSTSYRYLGEAITPDCTITNHLNTKGRESAATL